MPDRGERGPKGDHGQPGDIGLTGETGETGKRGFIGQRGVQGLPGESSILSRNVTLSFWLLLLVAVLVTSCQGYQLRETRHLISENRERINEHNRIVMQLKVLTETTNGALCSFVTNLEQRIATAQDYIADVKSGEREGVPGITLTEVQQSVSNQQATLDSLSGLPCH